MTYHFLRFLSNVEPHQDKRQEQTAVCSKSEAEAYFAEHFVRITKCDFVGTSFQLEFKSNLKVLVKRFTILSLDYLSLNISHKLALQCSFTCSVSETSINGRITCDGGKWTEHYDSDVEHLCVASKKPKKLKSSTSE